MVTRTSQIAIIDYGTGNLRSVQKALEAAGADTLITADPQEVARAAKIVLPGVGAVRPAMERLCAAGLDAVIRREVAAGKPFLGICLGYQLLFDASEEGGHVPALGIISGMVRRFSGAVRVPQMGWNTIRVAQPDCPLFRGLPADPYVYFCHSYYADPTDTAVVATWTDHGGAYASSVCRQNVWGVQFHPEKSQAVGLAVLRNFVAG